MLFKHLENVAFLWDLVLQCGAYSAAILFAQVDMTLCPIRRSPNTGEIQTSKLVMTADPKKTTMTNKERNSGVLNARKKDGLWDFLIS